VRFDVRPKFGTHAGRKCLHFAGKALQKDGIALFLRYEDLDGHDVRVFIEDGERDWLGSGAKRSRIGRLDVNYVGRGTKEFEGPVAPLFLPIA